VTASVEPATIRVARCDDCGADIASGLLACPGCARLVHRDQLGRLATDATAAERGGDLTAALGAWRRALELLPHNSTQHATIQQRMKELSAAVDGRGKAPEGVGTDPKKGGAGKAAAVGAVGLALLKSKALLGAVLANGKLLLAGLLKLPTLLSMLVFARWSTHTGLGFGLGLVASIYVHEVGHVAALRRYGIAASAPMFVPGLGAFVRMSQYPTDAHEEARTGLAGPLWGLIAAIAAAVLGAAMHSTVATSVASAGATLNLFNLIAVWSLDGSRGLRALNRRERLVVGGTGLLCSLVLHQWMPFIVGAVALSRAFGADAHATGDRRMCALFAGLIVVLSLIATLPVEMPR
jgi:Zn-dependent protease